MIIKSKKMIEKKIPKIDVNFHSDKYRHDIVGMLEGNENIGIELGVAEGIYSKRMIDSGKFKKFFGVDIYGDSHDTSEYKRAIKYVGLEKNYSLLRMSFDEAVEVFDNEYFDFIYIDGFAHTGEEGGKTLLDWYKKLKVGGVLAGDDYSDDWPLVKWAVHTFAAGLDTKINVTGKVEDLNFCRYPSWFIVKENNNDVNLKMPLELVFLGRVEQKKVSLIRSSISVCRKIKRLFK